MYNNRGRARPWAKGLEAGSRAVTFLFLQVVGVEGLDEVEQLLLLVDVQLRVDALRVRADGVLGDHEILGDARHGVARAMSSMTSVSRSLRR